MSEAPLKDRLAKMKQDLESMQAVLGVLTGILQTHAKTLDDLAKTFKDQP